MAEIPRGGHAVRVGPADAGRRVSLRARSADGGASDAVGTLRSWTDGRIVVRRRDGSETTLRETDLLAAIVVAPEWGAHDLQALAQDGWAPARTARLGDWVLRWDGGVTGRGSSVRVGADPATDLSTALATATRVVRTAWRDPVAAVTVPVGVRRPPRGRWLAGQPPHRVLDRSDERLLAAGEGTDVQVGLADAPGPAWVDAMDEPPGVRADVARILRRSALAVYATATDTTTGTLLGIARASVTAGAGRRSGHRWAGITSVHVLPTARRRGVATACMAALARWSSAQGADPTYLQVLSTNGPAIAFYDRSRLRPPPRLHLPRAHLKGPLAPPSGGNPPQRVGRGGSRPQQRIADDGTLSG